MARKKKHASHENHERWLVSYADFITLLFAFFVVMFASSNADKGKAAQMAQSVREALEEGHLKPVLAAILGGTVGDTGKGNAMMKGPGGTRRESLPPQEGALAELLPSLNFLTRELEHEIARGEMTVSLQPRGLVVSLQQAAFFPSGEDTIAPKMYPSLEKVAATLARLPNPIRMEGHTDAVPIHNSRFRSNWELSAARSIAMLELMAQRFQIPRHRMAIAGYAETIPIASNDTEQGRALNRRVDLVILNQRGLKNEPLAEAPGKPSPTESRH